LPARPVDRFPEAIFGLRCGGLFTQHQVTFEAKQFSEQPPFVGLLASLKGLLDHGQSISNLASTAQGFCNVALELNAVESRQRLAQFVKTGAQQTQATNNVTATNRKQCLKHTG